MNDGGLAGCCDVREKLLAGIREHRQEFKAAGDEAESCGRCLRRPSRHCATWCVLGEDAGGAGRHAAVSAGVLRRHRGDGVHGRIDGLGGHDRRRLRGDGWWLAAGRYSEEALLHLAMEHDPGFDPAWFAEALRAVDRLPDILFAPYGLAGDVSALKDLMRVWAKKIRPG